jgi:thermitase
VVVDSTGYATYANIASAVTYAADHGAKVINMSLAGPSYSATLQSAVTYAWNKGLVIVAAAGNANTNAPYYPAALTNVVAVSATEQYDQKASFSNYGSWIDVAAPGTYIYTTKTGGSYGPWQGTSFSSPQVAALAALAFSTNPALTNAQVVSLLRSSADDLGTGGFDDYFGWGRIDVAQTLQAALTTPPAGSTDTTAPTVAITSPTSGNSVSGTVMVQASASDNVGVTKVEFYVDGVLRATDSTASYSFSWNTTGLSGSHTLVAVASDAAGRSTSSAPVSVTVSAIDVTPPTVDITSLVYDGKSLTVTTSASDSNSGVVRVDLLVDGIVKATDTATPWSFKLNTRWWRSGSHTLQAKAYDAAGNTSLSAPKTFTK